MKETKEKPKHTKAPGTNGHSDKGWTDAGIARFAELIELVSAQRSGNDRARQEDKALEMLKKNPVHAKKTKKRRTSCKKYFFKCGKKRALLMQDAEVSTPG